MKEITLEQINDWINQAKIQGIYPITLIISKPDTPSINICGTEVVLSSTPLIYSVMGIDIWVDESIEKNKAYLIDKNSIVQINNFDKLNEEKK